MPLEDKNVLGGKLAACSTSPRTGFYRDGCCNTGPEDKTRIPHSRRERSFPNLVKAFKSSAKSVGCASTASAARRSAGYNGV
jgi:uncharacterized protein (DUF2237 family)